MYSQRAWDISENPLAIFRDACVGPGDEPTRCADELRYLRGLVLDYLGNKLSTGGVSESRGLGKCGTDAEAPRPRTATLF